MCEKREEGSNMKKGVLYFVTGFLTAGVLLQLTPGIAADIFKVVEAKLNTASIVVNGQKVEGDNLEYNDSLYLPLRKVGEALGKDVSWNDVTKTAEVKDKAPKPEATTQKSDTFIYDSDTISIIDDNTAEIGFKAVDQNNKEYDGQYVENNYVVQAVYGKASLNAEKNKVIIKDATGQIKNQTSIKIFFIDKRNGYINVKVLSVKAGK